jgi:hypothetical protein
MQLPTEHNWFVCDRFLELHLHWMTLMDEHLQTSQEQELEYWRIEKANSVVILPLQHNLFCCYLAATVRVREK